MEGRKASKREMERVEVKGEREREFWASVRRGMSWR